MPEGPECTIVANNLNEICSGKVINSIEILSGRYLKSPLDFSSIINNKITSVRVKGKFIYWNFQDESVLFSTLGMSGIYSKTKDTHSRVRFLLDKNLDLYYNDVRSFGTLKVTDQAELKKKLKEIGPDMLNEPCSLIEFKKIIEKHSSKILGIVLMNQKILSGIGNIYKSEICYLSRISPSRTLSSLSEAEISTLHQCILEILTLAYFMGGSSQKDFKSVDGKLGAFLNFAQVYRRTTDRLGNPVESMAIGDDRTTWWCPNVQK